MKGQNPIIEHMWSLIMISDSISIAEHVSDPQIKIMSQVQVKDFE